MTSMETDAAGNAKPDLRNRALPPLGELNRGFWTSGAEGVLRLRRCASCGCWHHPPKVMCPSCRSRDLVWRPVAGVGEVYTFTINHRPWNPAVPVPYVIALVELPEQLGLRLTTNVVNCDVGDVHIGMAVRVLFEEHGEIYVPVFEPV